MDAFYLFMLAAIFVFLPITYIILLIKRSKKRAGLWLCIPLTAVSDFIGLYLLVGEYVFSPIWITVLWHLAIVTVLTVPIWVAVTVFDRREHKKTEQREANYLRMLKMREDAADT